jgi:hypothetical protein
VQVAGGAMNAFQTSELQDIWGRIKDWPEELQVSLASKILSSLHHEPKSSRKNLADLVGVLASDAPPPTDEQVQLILQEERTRKFG